MLVARTSKDAITTLKSQLSREFEIKDLGLVNHILGMIVFRNRKNRIVWITQKFVEKFLHCFNM